jgi:hypothetical protein
MDEQKRREVFQGAIHAQLELAATGRGDAPFSSTYLGHALLIRVNDFPVEPWPYTMLIDGEAAGDLDALPTNWKRPMMTPPADAGESRLAGLFAAIARLSLRKEARRDRGSSTDDKRSQPRARASS